MRQLPICEYCGQADGAALMRGAGGEWCHSICRARALDSDSRTAEEYQASLSKLVRKPLRRLCQNIYGIHVGKCGKKFS